MLNNMFRGFQGERWCREFRTVFQEGSELVLFCKRHNVAEAHRDLFDHSLNDSEVVGAEESLVFEIHEEVMGSQEICAYNRFVDICYLEKPIVFVLVDPEFHATGSIGSYSRTICCDQVQT